MLTMLLYLSFNNCCWNNVFVFAFYSLNFKNFATAFFFLYVDFLKCFMEINQTNYSYIIIVFNPFSTNVPLLYPLKTSENRRFSDVFSRYRSGTLVENGLMVVLNDSKLWHFWASLWFYNNTR